jgi:hypothetical protein
MDFKKATIVAAVLIFVGWGYGCSQKADPEALAELHKMSSAVQDMGLVISAGITKDEYSRRLGDALLKFGNPGDKCRPSIAKRRNPDQQAGEICHHLVEAMDAYTYAKEYFGPAYNPVIDFADDTLNEAQYEETRKRFPTLGDLPVSQTNQDGYKFYNRSAMVQGLWQVAAQDSRVAKDLLERLS